MHVSTTLLTAELPKKCIKEEDLESVMATSLIRFIKEVEKRQLYFFSWLSPQCHNDFCHFPLFRLLSPDLCHPTFVTRFLSPDFCH